MKRYISSMQSIQAYARPKHEVEDKIEDKVDVILEHLACLYLFPNVQDTEKWRRDIRKDLHSMKKVRIGRKVRYLTPEEFYNATYLQNNDPEKLKNIFETMIDDKEEYVPDSERVSNISGYIAKCEEYFKWLAQEISKTGYIAPNLIYEELKSLGL